MSGSRRVAVTSPQTRLARAGRRYRASGRPPALDPADAEQAIVVYRRQRRRAVLASSVLVFVLLGMPAILALYSSGIGRIWGVPITWLLLGAAPFPVLVLVTFWQLYRAEHAERERAESTSVEDPG